MTLAITDLSTLDPAAVAALQAQLAGLITAQSPEVDLTRGVVHDIVLHLASVLIAAEEENVDLLRRSQSLLLVQQSPTAADPAVVDRILANFRVGRLTGRAASGQATLVLDTLIPVVIPKSATFSSGSATFAVTQSFNVRTDPTQVTDPTDRVLTAIGGGQYSFSIPVACTAVGAVGMVRRGQALTPGFVVPHLLQAFAASDFAGGTADETNAALVARLAAGVAAPCFGNRSNVAALIAVQPEFGAIVALSIVGAGDPELIRAARSILPVLLPGRCDVYARLAALPQALSLSATAVLVAVSPAGGTWQLAIPPSAAPGFYEVLQVATPALALTLSPADPGFAVTSDVRQAVLPSSGWTPDLRPAPPGGSAVDAAYTAYQAATIRFLDDVTPTPGLTVGTSTATYQVAVSALPGLADLQSYLGGRGVRPPGGDVLVRSPVPCDLSVGIEVRLPPTAAAPDPTAIAAAIATAVNSSGFVAALHSSTVAAAAQPLLPPGAAVGPVDLFGRVRRPDGTVVYLRDPRGIAIAIPEDPANGVSPRTTCFYLDPSAVAVTTRILGGPQI